MQEVELTQDVLADGGLAEAGKRSSVIVFITSQEPLRGTSQHPSTSQAEEPTAFIWQPKSLHNQGRESENT